MPNHHTRSALRVISGRESPDDREADARQSRAHQLRALGKLTWARAVEACAGEDVDGELAPGACGTRYCPTCAPHLIDDLRERLAARLERLGPGPRVLLHVELAPMRETDSLDETYSRLGAYGLQRLYKDLHTPVAGVRYVTAVPLRAYADLVMAESSELHPGWLEDRWAHYTVGRGAMSTARIMAGVSVSKLAARIVRTDRWTPSPQLAPARLGEFFDAIHGRHPLVPWRVR
jgi:hypothetical protein